MPKVINVALGILIRNNPSEFLLTSRPLGKTLAGYWEFPGGKIEDDETPLDALKRELKEEINISIDEASSSYLGQITHKYPHGVVYLDIILVTKWGGEIEAQELQHTSWQYLADEITVTPLLPTTQLVLDMLNKKGISNATIS